jgi:hypothetical protein
VRYPATWELAHEPLGRRPGSCGTGSCEGLLSSSGLLAIRVLSPAALESASTTYIWLAGDRITAAMSSAFMTNFTGPFAWPCVRSIPSRHLPPGPRELTEGSGGRVRELVRRRRWFLPRFSGLGG